MYLQSGKQCRSWSAGFWEASWSRSTLFSNQFMTEFSRVSVNLQKRSLALPPSRKWSYHSYFSMKKYIVVPIRSASVRLFQLVNHQLYFCDEIRKFWLWIPVLTCDEIDQSTEPSDACWSFTKLGFSHEHAMLQSVHSNGFSIHKLLRFMPCIFRPVFFLLVELQTLLLLFSGKSPKKCWIVSRYRLP